MSKRLNRFEVITQFQGVGHGTTTFDGHNFHILATDAGVLVVTKDWRPNDAASFQAFVYPYEVGVMMPSDEWVIEQMKAGDDDDKSDKKRKGG